MVVENADQRADQLFHALADATRRDIVRCTLQGEHSVSALAQRYPMSFAAVQKHVAVLERAGLVTKQRHGRAQLVRCNIDAIRTAYRLLDELEALWLARLDRFEDVLGDTPDTPDTPDAPDTPDTRGSSAPEPDEGAPP